MKKNDILITHGTDIKAMAVEICEKAQLDTLIGNTGKKIGIKPNLVNTSAADHGATTHPEIAAGLIEYLQDRGYNHISIIEGSWVGDRTAAAFPACGYTELKNKYNVELIDTQKDTYTEYDCKGVKINICDSALAVDFMINIPVMKGHCQTTITCALKNNKGVIPNSEKRRFHTMGLHKPIAHLNTVAKNDFIIVDGICGDLDFEEGGNPVQMNRMMGFADPVLCDAYVCSLLGYPVNEVPYIKMAEKLGVGSADTAGANVIEIRQGKGTHQSIRFTRRVEALAKKIQDEDACSACYGSLIHALDRLETNGYKVKDMICIGQGYQGKQGALGIGNCTSCFEKSLKGCPPKAIDIIEFLKNA